MAYTTINKSSLHMNTKLYTGNSSTQNITGLDFQPDWVWIKSRTSTHNNQTFDVLKGVQKSVVVNEAAVEITMTNGLTAFGTDGFTVGSDDQVNNSSQNYCSWNWKANGTGSANTDGDVTSTVSANTTSGFSIVKWDSTGTAGINIGHGLGQKPAMIIAKSTNISSTSWPVYHQSLGATKYLSLQATTASTTSATRWNNSEPTTTTFQTGSSGDIGGSDRTMIAYCFAEKPGYSKMGSYTGNGSSDGAMIYTGFKPAWVMIKRTDNAGNYWHIYDNKRSSSGGSNIIDDVLYPNRSDAEYSGDKLDIISNGIKFRSGNGDINASGGTYIYMAFGQSIVGSNNVPATAR
jgi:hypothetical protein